MTGPSTMRAIELTPERPVAALEREAVAAESAGLDAAFVSGHYNNRDQFAALTAMASATDQLSLGPGVANPYETHPVTLASRVATLDEYSGGRGVFGVGAGDISTLRNLGVDRERPLRRVLETVRVARRLWAGESVDHDGTFEASGASLNYAVGSIPVYVGAQGPDMTRMAAKYADGVLFNGAHPRDYEWASERVAEGLSARPDDGESRTYGADTDAFDVAAYASVSVAEDRAAARDAARIPAAFIVGGAPPPVLDRHGIDHERAESVGASVEAGEFSAAAGRVSEAMLDAFCIAGTPDDVDEQVAAVLEYADSFVAAAPLGPDVERAIELIGDVLTRRR